MVFQWVCWCTHPEHSHSARPQSEKEITLIIRAQASSRQPRCSRRSQIPDPTHLLSLSSGRERGKQHSCPITPAFVWPLCPQAQEQRYNPAMSVRLSLAPLRLCKRVCVCVCGGAGGRLADCSSASILMPAWIIALEWTAAHCSLSLSLCVCVCVCVCVWAQWTNRA